MEKPFAGRATINETYEGTEITIPAKKNWGVIAFLCLWMCGWVAGEVTAIGVVSGFIGEPAQVSGSSAFMFVWLAGWTFGGLFALRVLIWNLTGKEIISFRSGQLTVMRKGLVFARPKTYDIHEAREFRTAQAHFASEDMWGNQRASIDLRQNSGTIWFDYGMKTIKFANGIDEAEAKSILHRLKEKKILTERNFTA